MKTATNILNITEDISRSLAMTVEVGKEVNIRLADISLTVMKKVPGEESSRWEGGAVKVNTSLHHLLLTTDHRSLITQVQLPDQQTITGADSSITLSFSSYDNLGSLMNLEDEFSSTVLSVNVLGVEKVNIKTVEKE